MNDITPTLGILSSMITPAILIMASGSLIMTTSQRLSRVIERVRKISQEFMQIEKSQDPQSAAEGKRRVLYSLLKKSATRSKLLTRTLRLLYMSLGLFVATSLTIGVLSVTHLHLIWVPTAFAMIGAVLLLFSSAILVIESRLTYECIADEVDFVIESSRSRAPEAIKSVVKKRWHRWLEL